MEYSLLCPNQARSNGIIVNDIPHHLSDHQDETTHAIEFPEENIILSLKLRGCISQITTRTPTDQDLELGTWLTLTSATEWDPYSPIFAEKERLCQFEPSMNDQAIFALSSSSEGDSEYQPFPDHEFLHAICTSPHVSYRQPYDVAVTNTSNKRYGISKEELARSWDIGLSAAEQTLRVTTQKGIRNAIHPIHRRYRTRQAQLRYNQLGSRHGRFYTDTFFASVKSSRQNEVAQIFTNDIGFMRVVPMRLKSEAPNALMEFIQDIGIPSHMHSDNAKELNQGKWKQCLTEYQIKHTNTEPHSPWQNRAEGAIRELKKHTVRIMAKTNTPQRLWDYCVTYVAEIRSLTSNDLYVLHGRTPLEMVTGNTPDISEYTDFSWYSPLWYYDEADFPASRRLLGRWLGVAHSVGQALCYWILQENGQVIARTTVQPLTKDELSMPTVHEQLTTFNSKIQQKLGDSFTALQEPAQQNQYFQDIDLDEEAIFEPMEPEAEMPEADTFDVDTFLSAQVQLPKADGYERATVLCRKHDADGNPIGMANRNPILDTRVYEVQFQDGHVEDYATNVIAENLYAQIDNEGFHHMILNEIVDHRKLPSALPIDDMWITSHNGNQSMRRTTKGWELCILWKDGSTSWEPLRNLKESNPIELAEYAAANKIAHEPAFAWWVPFTLKTRDRIILTVRAKHQKRTHKFGIEVPTSVEHALEIDRKTGTDIWHKAIQKEMKNVRIAFEFLQPGGSIPIGYKWIPIHMIFDVKMDFTRKARLVAGGHRTDPPTSLTYSSVVSRDSVCIAFLLAALNDLDILAADIGNAYLNAPTQEKVYSTAGKEFGSHEGETIIIVRALYGLKSSSAAWRAHLAGTLVSLGFISCLADPDVWLRPATKPDGTTYYEYLLAYVDDILVLSTNPQNIMDGISSVYLMKDNSIGKPTRYLGADVI